MVVRVQGFDADFEFRVRTALVDAAVGGELLAPDSGLVDELLRYSLPQLGPESLRALIVDAGQALGFAEGHELLERARELVRQGLLIVVRMPRHRIASEVPELDLEPEVEAPAPIVERTDWIEILVLDEDDQPLANVPFDLILANGSRRRSMTDAHGLARCEGIPAGECQLELVDLDRRAWEMA